MTSDFNLPPGVTARDCEGAQGQPTLFERYAAAISEATTALGLHRLSGSIDCSQMDLQDRSLLQAIIETRFREFDTR